MRIGAVVLAAGLSTRFGKNKLMVCIQNRPMVGCALDALEAVPEPCVRAAVVSDERVADYVRSRGIRVIVNDDPGRGQAHSVALAAEAMRDMDAVLLMAADQPLIRPESVMRLVREFEAGAKGIACLRDNTHMGNPAIFSSTYIRELMALEGDRGAGRLLRAHRNDLLVVPCTLDDELADADTPKALEQINRRLSL